MSDVAQQDADHGSQSQSDAERDTDRSERAPFDLIFSVVNQIFRRAAALFDGAFRRADSIFERLTDSLFHALGSRSHLSDGGANLNCFIDNFSFHGCSSWFINSPLEHTRFRRSSAYGQRTSAVKNH
jgi:hypothetical protein